MGRRRWSSVPGRGSVVGDPAVLELVGRGDPGRTPRQFRVGGRVLVAYSSTRVHMKRDAWETLPPGGILVQFVCPTNGPPWAIALTPRELEDTFGEVANTRSWDDAREYHWPKPPAAAQSFKVRTGGAAPERAASARARATPAPGIDLAGVRRHLQTHGAVTEDELVHLAGTARAYRRLRRELEASDLPVDVTSTAEGQVWTWRR